MYYEDHYHPNAVDEEEYMPDIDMPSLSDSSSSVTSLDSNNKQKRKYGANVKNIDKDYRSISKIVNGKKKETGFYSTSSTPGAFIRDAISGFRYREYLVGSATEKHFFKVKYTAYKEPFTLFYSSPEQYERHTKSTLSQEMKQSWLSRSN